MIMLGKKEKGLLDFSSSHALIALVYMLYMIVYYRNIVKCNTIESERKCNDLKRSHKPVLFQHPPSKTNTNTNKRLANLH